MIPAAPTSPHLKKREGAFLVAAYVHSSQQRDTGAQAATGTGQLRMPPPDVAASG